MICLLVILKKLIKGESISKPIYDFVLHDRSDKTEIVEPKKVIILEGIFNIRRQTVLEI